MFIPVKAVLPIPNPPVEMFVLEPNVINDPLSWMLLSPTVVVLGVNLAT